MFLFILVFNLFAFLYSNETLYVKSFNEKLLRTEFSINLNKTVDVPTVDLKIEKDFKNSSYDLYLLRSYAFSYINDLIVSAIGSSQNTIDCMIYSINMKDIPDALIEAKNRGVKVRIIIDESHVYPKADKNIKKLIEAGDGIEVRTLRGTRNYGVMHNKITIHDRSVVTTGSYNWTFASTFSNYENIMIFRAKEYVKGYIEYFEWAWTKARNISDGKAPYLSQGYYGTPPQSPEGLINLNGKKLPIYVFSPGSEMEKKIAQSIDAAIKSVDAVTFSFTSKIIADAIINAKKRGLKVRFIQDEDMAKTNQLSKMLFDEGVDLRLIGGRNEKGAMHNKFIILDDQVLINGSYNFTKNGSSDSFENMVFINDLSFVNAYSNQFNWYYSNGYTPSSNDFDLSKPSYEYSF